MKYLKIHGLVTTYSKDAVIYLGRDSMRGCFVNLKDLTGHFGNLFTANVKCFGIPLPCSACQSSCR